MDSTLESYLIDARSYLDDAAKRADILGTTFTLEWAGGLIDYQPQTPPKLTREEALRLIETNGVIPYGNRQIIVKALRDGEAVKGEEWEESWSSSTCY